jgi:hypothetical protein
LIAGFVACADVNSGRDRVSVALQPVGRSRVSGTAILTSNFEGTRIAIGLRGLRPREDVLGVINAGDCEEQGASPLALPRLRSDGMGRARAYGPLRFRGREDVALTDLADADHAVRIIGRGELACGVVPKL